MGDKVNKRERGIWSAYTPSNTPFKAYDGVNTLYPLPSMTALKSFSDEIKKLQEYYQNGNHLFDNDGNIVSYEEAIALIHKTRYGRWLNEQEKN